MLVLSYLTFDWAYISDSELIFVLVDLVSKLINYYSSPIGNQQYETLNIGIEKATQIDLLVCITGKTFYNTMVL